MGVVANVPSPCLAGIIGVVMGVVANVPSPYLAGVIACQEG